MAILSTEMSQPQQHVFENGAELGGAVHGLHCQGVASNCATLEAYATLPATPHLRP